MFLLLKSMQRCALFCQGRHSTVDSVLQMMDPLVAKMARTVSWLTPLFVAINFDTQAQSRIKHLDGPSFDPVSLVDTLELLSMGHQSNWNPATSQEA